MCSSFVLSGFRNALIYLSRTFSSALSFALHTRLLSTPRTSNTAPFWTSTLQSLHLCPLYPGSPCRVLQSGSITSGCSPPSMLPALENYTSPGHTLSEITPPKALLAAPEHPTPLSRFLKHPQIHQALHIRDGTTQLFFQQITSSRYLHFFLSQRWRLVSKFGPSEGANNPLKESQ